MKNLSVLVSFSGNDIVEVQNINSDHLLLQRFACTSVIFHQCRTKNPDLSKIMCLNYFAYPSVKTFL